MLSVKQGGIKYHILSLWYDSTKNWTSVYQVIGEYSTNSNFGQLYIYIYILVWRLQYLKPYHGEKIIVIE